MVIENGAIPLAELGLPEENQVSTQVEVSLNWASLVGTREGRRQLEIALGRDGVVVAVCVHFTNYESPTAPIEMIRSKLGGSYTDEEIILALKNSKFRLLSARYDDQYCKQLRQKLDGAQVGARRSFDAYATLYTQLDGCWGNSKKIQQLINRVTPDAIGGVNAYLRALKELLKLFNQIKATNTEIVAYAKKSKQNPPVFAARPLYQETQTDWTINNITVNTETLALFVRGREEDGLGQIDNSFEWISAGTPLTEEELFAAKPVPETPDDFIDCLEVDDPTVYYPKEDPVVGNVS